MANLVGAEAARSSGRSVATGRSAWRRFFLALFTLVFSLLMALYATDVRESGHYLLGAALALVALVLTAAVAIQIVPRLVRRTALEHWMGKIEYEITREGVVYIVLVLAIGIAALNTGNNLLFIVLASLLAGILASGVLSRLVLKGLELELTLPDHLFAERAVAARLALSNRKRVFPSFSITISGRTPKKRENVSAAAAARRILHQAVYIPYLPHRATVSQSVEIIFPHRGRYTQDGFRVSTKFPFGLLRKGHELANHQEVIVLPNVEPTGELMQMLSLLGSEAESPWKGHGHDLYAIRDYQETDAARHVDWKASAKAQALKVREFTREDERRFSLIFDRFAPQLASPTVEQFERAVRFCASLSWRFYEMEAQMEFLTEDFTTPMASASEVIFPALEKLALVELAATDGPAFWASLGPALEGFRVIFTARPRHLIPPGDWAGTQFVFMEDLGSVAASDPP